MSVPRVEGQHVLSKYFFFYIFDLWSIVKLRGVCRRSWDLLGPLGVLLGASWGGLGASWGLLGPLGRVLGPLRVLLGCSWGLLGASWGGLGASWGLLGGSWGLLGRSEIGPKIDPKIDPKSSRIRDGHFFTGSTEIMVLEGSEGYRKSHPGSPQNYLSA